MLCSSVAMTKLFRIGRQEDAHEFLRYYVDSMQKACLKDLPAKYVVILYSCAMYSACVSYCVSGLVLGKPSVSSMGAWAVNANCSVRGVGSNKTTPSLTIYGTRGGTTRLKC